MRLQVGFSKVYSDRSTFSRAYREALKRVTLVEGGENQPTGEVNFSELLKKNMRIADLFTSSITAARSRRSKRSFTKSSASPAAACVPSSSRASRR